MAISGSDFVNGMIARGLSPPQAVALGGHIQQESGFDPTAYNPKEEAHGLLSWEGPRWTALQNFAKIKNGNPLDPNTQMDFIMHELTGPEAKAGSAFLSTSDLPSASAALKPYIRFGDNSGPQRLANAQALMKSGLAARPAAAPMSAAPAAPAPQMEPAAPQGDDGTQQALAQVAQQIQQPQAAPVAPPTPPQAPPMQTPDLALQAQMTLGRARQLAAAIRNRQMMEQQQQ